MSAEPLLRVLEATGYVANGEPALGVKLGRDAFHGRKGRDFKPDAYWRGPSSLTVYFKFSGIRPDDRTVSAWHREIWNEGFAPLLWVVSPRHIELYNGFGRPESAEDAAHHRLHVFELIDEHLTALDHLAGRLAMATGQFWLRSEQVTRKTSVDAQLLSDLAALERDLIRNHLPRAEAQALIGRSIFAQYLVDREIVNSNRLAQECGEDRLPAILRSWATAKRLFTWLAEIFNGDMFPSSDKSIPVSEAHLSRVADFLEAVDPSTGQTTFFPYKFDVIPVELISSIYEQFAHSNISSDGPDQEERVNTASNANAKGRGVHYTRLPVVSLILDEVLNGASGRETILDLACGSGVFLVEALRRLVARKSGDTPSRALIRETLHTQIFGVDISEAAIRVAAFSLYLAALELDPDPQPPEALRFEGLIGRSLLVGDAHDIETTSAGAPLQLEDGSRRTFDVIVGNPPWTFRGKHGTKERRIRAHATAPRQPRGEGLDFVLRAIDFGHPNTRYGIVLSAMPFFARSRTGAAAAIHAVEQISPVTLVNLSSLREWLFPTATMPAMILLARTRPDDSDQLTAVNVPWSPSAEKSHTFEIAPSDASVLSLTAWASDPGLLKATLMGRSRDMVLLNELRKQYSNLNAWLVSVGSKWQDGLIRGNEQGDAGHLEGLELLEAKALKPFKVPSDLPRFLEGNAERPRTRESYRAPLLLVKEFLVAQPRPIAAVSERDLVYTDAYFGASLPKSQLQSARLIAGILSSALSGWFFLMTATELGIWKRRLHKSDVGLLPVPDPAQTLRTEPGQRLLELVASLHENPVSSSLWHELDNTVFDLYGLEEIDRIVVNDGFLRAAWQWEEGRIASASPARTQTDLKAYANAFLTGIDAWLQATSKRHVRAEIINLPYEAALRVVRIVVAEGRQEPFVEIVSPQGNLSNVLDNIGHRLDVRLGEAFVGERELRVHGANEVVIIKPAARRFWMGGAALEDADAVVSESFVGTSL